MNRRMLLMGGGAFGLATLMGCSGNRSAANAPALSTENPVRFTSERISVAVRGAGPDVVLIPGMTSHRDIWNETVAALEGRYRFHLVQINGFAGFPAVGNADGPVSAPVAEEIARYIAVSGLNRPAVIGHSMGGTIGLMIAARHLDAVSRLMVVDMVPFLGAMFGPPGTTAESIRPLADQRRAAQQSVAPGQLSPTMERMISAMTRSDAARPALLSHARASDPQMVGNSFHEMLVTDLRPELARITVPVTVIYILPPGLPISAEDMDAFYAAAYANAPNRRLTRIADSNHFIMIDQPVRFEAEVEAFMAR